MTFPALSAATHATGIRRFFFGALLCIAGGAQAAGPVALRLIGINDFHGNLEPPSLQLQVADPADPTGKPLSLKVGGAAALSGLVRSLRASSPNSIMLAAGDLIGASPLVSTLFKHESTIAVMNQIGLELDAVGNHEFDAGIAELQRIGKGGCAPPQPNAVATSCTLAPYRGAKFPLVSSNVLGADGKPVLAPFVIKRVQGIPVGVIGAVTRTTPGIVIPSGIEGLSFIDEADGVNRAAKELRARGVKAIIAVFHEGGELGTQAQRGDWNDVNCPAMHGPILDIAKRLSPEISVIFTGHTHQGYRCFIEGRHLIQGTSYGRGVSVIDVKLDPKRRTIITSETKSINLPVFNERTDPVLRERLIAAMSPEYAEIERNAKPDPAVAKLVAEYVAAVAPTADRPVGTAAGSFTRRTVTDPAVPGAATDSAAGRLIADAQLAATRAPDHGGAQIAFMNAGGIRTDLDCKTEPPCTLSFGQVFTAQPFGNDLVSMTLTGAQIKQLLESQLKADGHMSPLQPSAGLTYTWYGSRPAGEHVGELMLNGEPIVADRPYRVTVSNFLAEGGDGFRMLLDGSARTGGGQDLDALLAYLKSAPLVAPITTPRITLAP